MSASPSASSWQAAIVPPGGAPEASRGRGYEPRPQAPHQPMPGFIRRRSPEPISVSRKPASACSIHRTSPEDAPRRARHEEDKAGLASGDKFLGSSSLQGASPSTQISFFGEIDGRERHSLATNLPDDRQVQDRRTPG